MKTRFRCNDDDWFQDERKITDAENLEAIRRTITDDGPIILEHWFYRGSCAPNRFIFDDFEELLTYLNDHAFAGDDIVVWSFASVCNNDNQLALGKCPDENGLVPRRGAYQQMLGQAPTAKAEPSHARQRRWPADFENNVNSRRPVMRAVMPPTPLPPRQRKRSKPTHFTYNRLDSRDGS